MKRDALIIFGLIAITLVAFAGIGQCGFVNFDDPGYIVNNPHVTRGLSHANFAWAWTTIYEGNYIPLTWLSLMLDATLFGFGPHGFHWVNLAFHAANAVLLFLFFRHATGAVWRSALVAAIFAVHPLRVESVVWVVERKDVLTGFFGLLTMLAYLRYTRALKRSWYAATLGLFATTLLAKQTWTTLPCVFLLLDYWPLGRWNKGPAATGIRNPPRLGWARLILEKAPLLAIAAGILGATFRAQAVRSMSDLKSVPLAWRLANAPISYARYLGRMVWFGDLAVYYPRHPWSITPIVGSCLLLLVITAICLWKLRSRPWLIVGWLWFLGVLVPMIGLVQFGPQSMADRFTYMAGIGLLIMVAWSIPATVAREPVLVITVVGMTLGLLIVFTLWQTRYWQNSISLFTRDIELVGSTSFAELNLGVAWLEYADMPRADAPAALAHSLHHLERSVKLEPRKARAQAALAVALAKDHKIPQAIEHCKLAVHLEPDNPDWSRELVFLLSQSNHDEEALRK